MTQFSGQTAQLARVQAMSCTSVVRILMTVIFDMMKRNSEQYHTDLPCAASLGGWEDNIQVKYYI